MPNKNDPDQGIEQVRLGIVGDAEPESSTPEQESPRPERSLEVAGLVPSSRSAARNRRQEFFIPVHGIVRLTLAEVELVDHPAFQRLGGIYQLGQTHVVYRGATHKRLEHCLGTLHVTQLIVDALDRNSGPAVPDPDDRVGEWTLGEGLSEVEVALVRLGALLHDIGHLPAGHTFEDELGLLPAHDKDGRLDLVLDRTEWNGERYEPTLRELIDRLYASEATGSGMSRAGKPLTASEVLYVLVSKDEQEVESAGHFRIEVCRNIIGNTICADLLDYLHRDWLHVGKPRYFDARLLEYMEIRGRQTEDGVDSRLVMNLRGGNKIRTDAVTGILDLLESRYQLFEIALFHRTKLCAAAMLERAVAELADGYPGGPSAFLDELPERLLDLSDLEMLSFLEQSAKEGKGKRGASNPQTEAAGRLLHKLRLRRLHKELRTAFEYNLADVTLDVQDRYAGPADVADRMDRARIGAKNRLDATRLLEADFGLEAGSIVVYCPPREMGTKIAEVEVLVHSHVHTLEGFERDNGDRGVTGGHLRAQQERFRRLWRILFAIDPGERQRLEDANLLQALGTAIDLCVLRIPPTIGSIDDAVQSLARDLTTIDASPLNGKQLVDETAARGEALLSYPGGTRSLLSCVTE